MSAPVRLAAFAAVLAVLFGGGTLAGAAIGPDTRQQEQSDMASHTEEKGHGDDHPVRGLAVSEGGLRLVVEDPELRRGRTETLRFRVVDDRGTAVRDFDVEHERRMHLILARRDLTGFQHLHPELEADGTWTTQVRLDAAGSYRLLADFVRGGEPYTLASDLRVDGPADLQPLPPPSTTATSDGGYDVRLDAAAARPNQEAELRFTITRGGETVRTEPYLGAGGHLVALREGDLAFLHVHPTDHNEGGSSGDGAVGFAATFPSAGRYRLFLQFKHEGRVHTVAFTQEVT